MTKIQRKLVDMALRRWADWLTAFFAKVPQRRSGEKETDVYESLFGLLRLRDENSHGDPVLAAYIADEGHANSWPKSIHALICDYPKSQRMALLGAGLGYTHESIAQHAGVSTQHVSTLLSVAKRSLAISLMVMDHVRRSEEAEKAERRAAA